MSPENVLTNLGVARKVFDEQQPLLIKDVGEINDGTEPRLYMVKSRNDSDFDELAAVAVKVSDRRVMESQLHPGWAVYDLTSASAVCETFGLMGEDCREHFEMFSIEFATNYSFQYFSE